MNKWSKKIVDILERNWEGRNQSTALKAFAMAADSGSSFLDLGCGYGRFYDYLKRNMKKQFRYTGYDSSSAMIKKAIAKYPEAEKRFILRDVTKRFQNNAAVIMCHDLFFHLRLKDQEKILSSINISSAKTVIITIQITNREPVIEKATLDGQEFLNIVQDLDEFKQTLAKTISDMTSIQTFENRLNRRRGIYKSTIIIKR